MRLGVFYLFIITLLGIFNSVDTYACNDYGTQVYSNPADYKRGQYFDGTRWFDCEAGYFCTGDGREQCCPADHPESAEGTTDLEDCYKNIQCIHQTMDNTITCKEDHDGDITCTIDGESVTNGTIHYETENSTDVCYTGYLNCDQFGGANNSSCPNGTVSGYAKWELVVVNNAPQRRWHTTSPEHRCKCEQTSHSSDRHCTAKSLALPLVDPTNATTPINYDTAPDTYCSECDSGYYVNYSTDMEANTGESGCVDNAVCRCSIIPKGYYLESECEPLPESFSFNQHICPPNLCPPGMTTNNPGTIASNPCRYGGGTKICVGSSCVDLQNMVSGGNTLGLPASSWTRVGN